jgi:hypothetical protein
VVAPLKSARRWSVPRAVRVAVPGGHWRTLVTRIPMQRCRRHGRRPPVQRIQSRIVMAEPQRRAAWWRRLLRWILAVAQPSSTNFSDGTNASSYTTATNFTSNANSLYLAALLQHATALKTFTSLVHNATTNPVTFVKIIDVTFNTIASPLDRLVVCRAMKPNASNAGTITTTWSGTVSRNMFVLAEFTGTDTSGTDGSGAIVQTNTGQSTEPATSLSITLTGASSSNATYGAFGVALTNTSMTVGSGYTRIVLAGIAAETDTLDTEWRADGNATVNETFTSGNAAGGAIEIKAAAGAAFVRNVPVMVNQAVNRAAVM